MNPEGREIHVACISPTDDNGKVDFEALQSRLMELSGLPYITGISLLGSTGEGPSLSASMRSQVRRNVGSMKLSGTIISSGVFGCSVDEVLAEIEDAATCAMDAVLLPPPFYYRLNTEEVYRFYFNISDRSPLPVIIYNIPNFTKTMISEDVVERLAVRENIAGIKDSSRDFPYFQRIVDRTKGCDFKVYTGSDDMLLASTIVGGHGTICASANIVPDVIADLYDAIETEDWLLTRQLQMQLAELGDACRLLGGFKGWKLAQELLGQGNRQVFAPGISVLEGDSSNLSVIMDKYRRLLRARGERTARTETGEPF